MLDEAKALDWDWKVDYRVDRLYIVKTSAINADATREVWKTRLMGFLLLTMNT